MNTQALLFLAAVPALIAPAAVAAPQGDFAAAQALVQRLTPEYAGRVCFRQAPDVPVGQLSREGDKLLITAATTREAIRSYGWYLRNMAHVHFSWNGDNKSAADFVLPEQRITIPEGQALNYALNYCTLSYSGTHWDKDKWERELDIFALNGYTHILVTAGLETVWSNFLERIGYPKERIASFIPNPAFSAWWNMGNLEGMGGPVSPVILREEAALGRFLVQRMQELGMTPVLQAFVGLVPHDLDTEETRGHIIRQGNWVAGFRRPDVLNPTAPAFARYASVWYEELQKVYGSKGSVLGGDLFHEGGHTGGIALADAARAVQASMQQNVPGAIWLLQSWAHNPSPAFLSGTDPKKTLVLLLDKDLRASHDPYYPGTRLAREHVRDYPHIWCELANFGGNHGLFGGFGVLENYAPESDSLMGRESCLSRGLGLISEGIETNPIYYALLTERMNQRNGIINRRDFINNYVLNRYGIRDDAATEAWSILADSVYNPTSMREGCQESLLCARPKLNAKTASTWSDGKQYYDYAKVEEAARLLLRAGKQHQLGQQETFVYDLADVVRQVLADRARVLLPQIKDAYDARDAARFATTSEQYLQLIRDTAAVLATSRHFLLGSYLEGARAKGGQDPEARRQMEQNLKLLLTTWTHGNTGLNDYAHRQLAEMMSSYYLPRWQRFFREKQQELSGNAPTDSAVTAGGAESNNGLAVSYSYEQNAGVDQIQESFWKSDIPLLTEAQGDIIALAEQILNR